MAKYIDAEKLLAEIISLRHFTGEKLTSFADEKYVQGIRDGRSFICNECLALIDSLQQEQQEVDLDKESLKYFSKILVKDDETPILCDFKFKVNFATIARHFFELGLNARKED